LPPDRASPATSRWLKRGVFGLAAVSAAAWALKRKPAGDGDASGRPPKDPPESTLRKNGFPSKEPARFGARGCSICLFRQV
jgi:hypothetical protein